MQVRPRCSTICVSALPLSVLLERVAQRTNNPYGKTPEQQDEVRRYLHEVEPLLKRGAGLHLDGRLPVADFADEVETLLGLTS